ncbi:MAG: carboxypeptidase regulatory-like domain-containing protein [Bryobacteraceae bacterium]
MSRCHRSCLGSLPALVALGLLLAAGVTLAQSTGGIQGTVIDATGAAVHAAQVIVHNQATGEERNTLTDDAGVYHVPSLPVGTYQVQVKAPGMQTATVPNLAISVGTTVRQNITLNVASSTQTVEVEAAADLIQASDMSVGDVVNQHTVQEIPLNGRHFVDLALLTPGTVTPPANGFLTAPLRGQGSFSFVSAGGREDTVNFMINGINLNDPSQNQVTFQPVINTIEELSLDNSTFSAEYGRSSGSIVNIATRSGVNAWHGEAYEFMRNDFMDARNFTNPDDVTKAGALVPNPENEFIRNQFGGDGGGAIKKNKLFAFLSFEGLRQRQAVPLSATVLTSAQRQQAQSTSDSQIQALLPLIPQANSGSSSFVGSMTAPVNIEQGTANVSYLLNDNNRFNFYYAIQRDQRNEPSTTDGNSFPGEGDQRNGHRQLLTINETSTISPALVNEFRAGANRIHLVFAPDNVDSASAFGIDSGITAPIGLPQIAIAGAFTFGGINNFPQGRGDNVIVTNDTLSWTHGNHIVKMGGEFRRQNEDSFTYTPGTFSFPSITAFLADQANSFTVNDSNRALRDYANSIGAFITDSWKVAQNFTVTLGVRYDWYATPTEAENRFVIFNPSTDTLQHVGQGSGPSSLYNQNVLAFDPRVGLVWDPFKTGKTVIRSGFAIMRDQPNFGLSSGAAYNPPYAQPISYVPPAGQFVSLFNAFPLASGAVAPYTVPSNYKDDYVTEWNLNIQQEFKHDYVATVNYVGTKGTDLNIERNLNQFIGGVRPYPALSASSPIDPGMPLSNITQAWSGGNSSYQALWAEVKKRFASGLQFDGAYTYSKSIDDVSQDNFGVQVQNSYCIACDRGLSDFDARNRFVLSGIYDLPFKGNRFKAGWQFSLINTLQSGSPFNIHIANTSLTGVGSLRPDVTGPLVTGFSPATNGSPTNITYIQNAGLPGQSSNVFVVQGTNGVPLGFGNLGRNVAIGPGFEDLDLALVKNTALTERLNLQLRCDAFDMLNHPNFTNPGGAAAMAVTVGPGFGTSSTTQGLITGGTRFTSGDFGTSRQLQVAMKFQF